jgi:excisionase family DNA binding protein
MKDDWLQESIDRINAGDFDRPPPVIVQLPSPRLALTVTEAAEALGVSPDHFREHIDRELRWIRRGRKRLVAVRELEAWLDRNAALDLDPRETT